MHTYPIYHIIIPTKGLKKDTDYPDFFGTVYGRRRGEVPPLYPFKQAEEIIRLINDAGGIAVVAHPANQLHLVEDLTKMGIAGIEVWHPDLRLRHRSGDGRRLSDIICRFR